MNIKKYFTTLIMSMAAWLVVLCIGLGLYGYYGNIGGGDEFEELDVATPTGVRNVLVLGTDGSGLRSDVIMLFSINPKKQTISLVSIPRDTKTVIGNSSMKINSALAIGGEKLTIQKVKEIAGIPIHDYITFNFEAVEDIIDILDGVDFNIPQNMDYEDPEQDLYIHLKAGQQHLNGEDSVKLMRFRRYSMGDIQRNAVQQDFIKAMFEQKAKLDYFSKLPEVYGAVNKNMVSSLSLSDAKRYATTIKKMSNAKFRSFEMPFEIQDPYVITKQPDTRIMFEENFKDNE